MECIVDSRQRVAIGISRRNIRRKLRLVHVRASDDAGHARHVQDNAILRVFASLLLVPVILIVHPPMEQMRDLLLPKMPEDGKLSEVMLLIIAIVDSTVWSSLARPRRARKAAVRNGVAPGPRPSRHAYAARSASHRI
jgi:hypothetical protein